MKLAQDIGEVNFRNTTNVIISEILFNQLFKSTALAYPREACALLFGNKTNENVYIKEIFPAKNRKKSIYRFAIRQDELDSALRMSDHKILGVFHSHLNGTIPSALDKKNMAKKEALWLIGYWNHSSKLEKFRISAYVMINNVIHKLRMKRRLASGINA